MKGDRGKSHVKEEQRRAIRNLFAALPKDYEDQFTTLRDLRHIFQEELARAFEPTLNHQVKIQPAQEEADRIGLTAQIDMDLDLLGLSILGPRGRSARLLVDTTPRESGKRIPILLMVKQEHVDREEVGGVYDDIPTFRLRGAPHPTYPLYGVRGSWKDYDRER